MARFSNIELHFHIIRMYCEKVLSAIGRQLYLLPFLVLFSNSTLTFCQLWSPVPIAFDYEPKCFYNDSSNGLLYIGGNFERINGISVFGLISFDGTAWDTLRTDDFCFPVLVMEKYQGKLYVGGFGGLLIYDGTNIERIPCNGQIRSLHVYQGKLLVGGLFQEIGGSLLSTLAAWDGTNWLEFNGTQQYFINKFNTISAIEEYRNELYLAGNIYGNGNLSEIMKWNGNSWMDVGGGIHAGASAWINDLKVFKGGLYVAGYFFEQNGGPGNCIVKWEGNGWSRLGGGSLSGQVLKLHEFEDKLFAIGQFEDMAGISAQYIAHWDGTEWCTLGCEIDNSINGIEEFQNELYISGGFSTIDNDSIRFLGKWVGGNYVDTCIFVPVNTPEFGEANPTISIYPNPTNSSFTLTLPPNTSTCSLKIHDITGREVAPARTYRAGDPPVDVAHLRTGLYFVEVWFKDRVEVIKLVKEN